MIKQYNEFMCAHCGEDIELRVGQTYFVDGKRMRLSEIRNGRYIFVKGDDIVNVPEDKLDRYVSEKRKHIMKFESLHQKESYNYFDIETVDNGLWIYLNENSEDYDDMTEQNFDEYFEDIQGNSEYMYFQDIGETGFGLTSAPGITDGYYYDDNGDLTDDEHFDSNVYWFPNYQIEDFTETLKKEGKVFFHKGE